MMDYQVRATKDGVDEELFVRAHSIDEAMAFFQAQGYVVDSAQTCFPSLQAEQLTNWVGEINAEEQRAPGKDQINPAHHKGVIAGLEYTQVMEEVLMPDEGLMSRLEELGANAQDLEHVRSLQYIGHLRSHAFKYQLRRGRKDASAQEDKKAAWYTDYLAKFMERKGF